MEVENRICNNNDLGSDDHWLVQLFGERSMGNLTKEMRLTSPDSLMIQHH